MGLDSNNSLNDSAADDKQNSIVSSAFYGEDTMKDAIHIPVNQLNTDNLNQQYLPKISLGQSGSSNGSAQIESNTSGSGTNDVQGGQCGQGGQFGQSGQGGLGGGGIPLAFYPSWHYGFLNGLKGKNWMPNALGRNVTDGNSEDDEEEAKKKNKNINQDENSQDENTNQDQTKLQTKIRLSKMPNIVASIVSDAPEEIKGQEDIIT